MRYPIPPPSRERPGPKLEPPRRAVAPRLFLEWRAALERGRFDEMRAALARPRRLAEPPGEIGYRPDCCENML